VRTLLNADFSAGYPGKQILENVRFEMRPGEILGLAGGSGTGKSTLVLAILGLLQDRGGYVEGKLIFDGFDLLRLKRGHLRRILGSEIALIPPSPHSALNPRVTLLRHFKEAWHAHNDSDWAHGIANVRDRLAAVSLPADDEFLKCLPGEISTGQAQRVLIALALLHRPRLLIADEPTSALDTVTQAGILSLLKQINERQGTAILFVSHDLVAAASLCHRMAVLSDRTIVEVLDTAEMSRKAIHPATIALLAAIPEVPSGMIHSPSVNSARNHPPSSVRTSGDPH
jgi:ABC-type dipeptide/oligopeptide/nickel transport system ATPase component